MENNEEITFDEIVEGSILPASKGPMTNALVHNPFTYSDADDHNDNEDQ